MLARCGAGSETDDRPRSLHAAVFADLVEAIREGRPPAADGRAARVPVELMLAIYESCRSGAEVRLPFSGTAPA